MSTDTEAQTIAQYAQQAAEPEVLAPGTVYAVSGNDGRTETLDTDEYAEHPRFVQAERKVIDTDSFVRYLAKHTEAETEVYANPETSSIVAVIDAHAGTGGAAGWQKHRVTLELQRTKSWTKWLEHDGKWFQQTAFAEFIEQRATDVAEPQPGDLMSLAQNFYMTKGVEYQSSERLDNGETKLVYKEKITTKGLGNLEVPKELKLVLQPYTNGPRQYAIANFRTRLDGSTLLIGYVLVRPEEILEGVFKDLVAEIRDGRPADAEKGITELAAIAAPVFFGKP